MENVSHDPYTPNIQLLDSLSRNLIKHQVVQFVDLDCFIHAQVVDDRRHLIRANSQPMHFAEDARRHRGGNAAKAAPCASCYRGECDGEKNFLCHLVSAFLS